MTPTRTFLIGSTVSLPATTTLAVIVYDPACPHDLVAVVELREGNGCGPHWFAPDQLKLCTCSIPESEHDVCETHGRAN
jgi:hypothetical protein